MSPDPRWLEVLKASGWQTLSVALASGLFLLLAALGWVPALAPWMKQAAAFGLLLGACLSLGSLATSVIKWFPIHLWFARWIKRRSEERELREYIPHMTPRERQIIGYLLAKNQTSFGSDSDGGYAANLLSRGIVRVVAKHGQHIDVRDVPMYVPKHLWKVLETQRAEFPYSPSRRGEVEVQPWRIGWMAR
jgi:hypothetical protein